MAHAIHSTDYVAYAEAPGVIARLRRTIAGHRRYLATLHELGALTDRELADIGLSRLNVRDVARRTAYGL